MALSRDQISLIHVAKSRLRLSEDDYRDVLRHVGGAEHANELDQLGFADVMDWFRGLGFESDFHKANLGTRAGMASAGQVALIRKLWRECTDGQGDDLSLGRWLTKYQHISSVRFIPNRQAGKVIAALLAMKANRARKHQAAAGDRANP